MTSAEIEIAKLRGLKEYYIRKAREADTKKNGKNTLI